VSAADLIEPAASRCGVKESAVPREVELKLRLPPDSRAVLEASGLFTAAPAQEFHQVTTYFDTLDSALDRAGLTLRVRRIGAERIQTVNSRADGRGVTNSRNEWEWRIGQDTPDLTRLAKTSALAAASKTVNGKLTRLFVTDIHRTVRLLHLDNDTVVEAAIDRGTIAAGRAQEPVSELELELKAGCVAPIYRLAADLQTLVPLWISPESKAARGWRLLTGHMSEAQPARPPKLRRSVLAAPGFQVIIAGTLGHLMTNIGPTLGGAAEGVHEMRIALRATRAALKLFEPHLAASTAGRFDTQLQRFSRMFGTARDWDVFCMKTLPAAAAELATGQLRGLRAAAEVQRRIAHKAVVGYHTRSRAYGARVGPGVLGRSRLIQTKLARRRPHGKAPSDPCPFPAEPCGARSEKKSAARRPAFGGATTQFT